MSIGETSCYAHPWQTHGHHGRDAAGSGATTATSTASASGGTANSGSRAGNGDLSAFMRTLTADLQAMLARPTTGDGATAASSATNSQTAANRPSGGTHHHHHFSGANDGGSMQTAANHLVGQVGQSLRGGSLSGNGSGTDQAASTFAGDIAKALRSYGAAASSASGPPMVA